MSNRVNTTSENKKCLSIPIFVFYLSKYFYLTNFIFLCTKENAIIDDDN